MKKLVELAHVLRSKNSGPFEVTFDILFDNPEYYEKVKAQNIISVKTICNLYRIEPNDVVCIVFFDKAMGIKITINRKISSGTCLDRDVYGAQQHAPLMELEIPE